MDPIITPALLLVGLLALVSKTQEAVDGGDEEENGKAAKPSADVVFSPEARSVLLIVAGGVQSFRPTNAKILARALRNESLERVTEESGSKGLYFQVIPGAGDLSVEQALTIAAQKGLVALGSLSLALVDSPAPRFVRLVRPEDVKRYAGPASSFAVLSQLAPVAKPVVEMPIDPKADTLPAPTAEASKMNGASAPHAAPAAESDPPHAPDA
jgi:hypothetical protein